MTPPEKLNTQVIDVQGSVLLQFLPSLLRLRGGFGANHTFQPLGFSSELALVLRVPNIQPVTELLSLGRLFA